MAGFQMQGSDSIWQQRLMGILISRSAPLWANKRPKQGFHAWGAGESWNVESGDSDVLPKDSTETRAAWTMKA
jgi:hypothetical protein